jgi:hypothetical protein
LISERNWATQEQMESSETQARSAIFTFVVLACLLGACSRADGPMRPQLDAAVGTDAVPPAGLRPVFCERANDDADAVRDVFCGAAAPAIASLSELQAALGVTPGAPASRGEKRSDDPNQYYVRYPALLGHSTALSGHLVSPLNPRAVLIGLGTVLAFQRGVQQVEIATLSRTRNQFNFYLLRFSRACGDERQGCNAAELYTQRVERDWSALRVHDAEELENTPQDCLQCHKRGRDAPVLLMRELERPWTHFFEPNNPEDPSRIPAARRELPGVQGADLMRDYRQGRGDEPYANVDVTSFPEGTPSVLQAAVGRQQPLFFDVETILAERYPKQVSAPQPSPTWERSFEAFKRGEQLALPYYETRVTDPDKQSRLSEAYRRHRDGELSDDELPDLRDIFPDDPAVRARIGLETEEDASPAQALIQACGACHNDVLDQSLSRARFNIDVSRLSAEELALAVERIEHDREALGAMPPSEARQLHPRARGRLLEFLRDAGRTRQPDPRLVHAAEMGMLGGARE